DQLRDFWHGALANKPFFEDDVRKAIEMAHKYTDVGIHIRDSKETLRPTLSPNFAALGLRSRRALSSAGCNQNLSGDDQTRKTFRCLNPRPKTKRAVYDFTKPFFPSNDENQKLRQKSVTSRPTCVTYVLSQECYRCPDCAHSAFVFRTSNFCLP